MTASSAAVASPGCTLLAFKCSTEQLNVYSILHSFCLQCVKDDNGQMNFCACLSHIAYLFALIRVCGHRLSSHANLWQLAQQLHVPSVPIAPHVNTPPPSKPYLTVPSDPSVQSCFRDTVGKMHPVRLRLVGLC